MTESDRQSESILTTATTPHSAMENTSRLTLTVNMTGLSSRVTGAGAYARFCASVVRSEFNAQIANTPAWIERLPQLLKPVTRYIASGAVLRRASGVIYNPTYRAAPGRCGQIVTVLDLIPLMFPRQHVLMTRYFREILPNVLRTARGVIVLSETLRERVARQFDLDTACVCVVPPGVDRNVFCPGDGDTGSDAPYLLAAGASLAHKNISELLVNAPFWSKRYRLVVTGVSSEYMRILKREARVAGIGERVTFEQYVTQQQMVALYRGCTALVYPSLDEGFGLPPLEALACGRPVIVSDIPVIREVCAEAALYVRPGDSQSWARTFAALESGEGRERAAAHGEARVRAYSWERTRETLIAAIAKLVGARQ